MNEEEVKKMVYIAYELGWIHDRHDGQEPPPEELRDVLNDTYGKNMATIPMLSEDDVRRAERLLMDLGIMDEEKSKVVKR